MATINIAEFALALDTDARTARKFLRNITPAEKQPGKGARWEIEKREVRSLKSKFGKYTESEQQKRLDREKAKRDSTIATEDGVIIAEVTHSDLEPTDAELEMIEDEIDLDD